MILCYGEILADFIGSERGGTFAYERYAGGAPFNVACAAAKCGAESGFVGSVGDDIIGKYLIGFAEQQNLKKVDIDVINSANTTLAFVELDKAGERSFCFYRKNTADYIFDEKVLEFVKSADIVHLGSLMLSEKKGVAFAEKLVDCVKKHNKKLSFDINYRDDIFPDKQEAKKVYEKFASAADMVKYSKDELELFTGKTGLGGLADVSCGNKLVCVTLGEGGSAYCQGKRAGIVPSIKVEVADTTGAGDAFYGALLSKLDNKNLSALTDSELYDAFRFANVSGALAATARGAISALASKEKIQSLL